MKREVYSTGSIIPLGDGATGKSVLTQLIINNPKTQDGASEIVQKIKKSLNIEMEYASEKVETEEESIASTLQFYVFPGQRQKISAYAPTFDEILEIFEFLPALKDVNVLLLVYDTTRLESLKSLESWLQIAIAKDWLSNATKIVLVSNKIDLQPTNKEFVNAVRIGIIEMLEAQDLMIPQDQIATLETSGVTLEGLENLRNLIFEWIAIHGKRRIKA